MAANDQRYYYPQVLDRDEDGVPRLEPHEVSNALMLAFQAIHANRRRIEQSSSGSQSAIVSGGAVGGIVIVEVLLSGNYTVPFPTLAPNKTIIIYVFRQDPTGGRVVSWPAQFLGAVDVGHAASSYSVFMWLKISPSVMVPVAPFVRGV